MGGKAGQISHLFFSNFDSSWLSAHFLVSPPLCITSQTHAQALGAGRWGCREGRSRNCPLSSLPPSLLPPVLSLISVLLHIPLHLLSAFLSETLYPASPSPLPSFLLSYRSHLESLNSSLASLSSEPRGHCPDQALTISQWQPIGFSLSLTLGFP